jgi:mono/diheme cytochrome c family protein
MARTFLFAAIAVLLFAALPASAQQQGSDPFLPPGDGHDLVQQVCTSCHPARTFAQLRQNDQAWRRQIMKMMMAGAQVGPDDIDPIVKYLSTSFGPGVALQGPPPPQVTLADGQGKELVQGACALCHGLDRVTGAKRTDHQWDAIVERMVFFGAPLSADQAKTVHAYLTSSYGAN